MFTAEHVYSGDIIILTQTQSIRQLINMDDRELECTITITGDEIRDATAFSWCHQNLLGDQLIQSRNSVNMPGCLFVSST